MTSWTGGQYSLFRITFSLYLIVFVVTLWQRGVEMASNTSAVAAVLGIAVVLAAGLAIGWWDRVTAAGLACTMAYLYARDAVLSDIAPLYAAGILMAMVFFPQRPYGSWARRGDPDPGWKWRYPVAAHIAAWAVLALGYSYEGYIKLHSPEWLDGSALRAILEMPMARESLLRSAALAMPDALLRGATWGVVGLTLSFAPLALFARLRPWLWSAMLAVQLSVIATAEFADIAGAMAMLHLFTVDPGWAPPLRPATPETLFYDGHCGLCHRTVRFVLSEDRAAAFRFAPLQGETFAKAVPENKRASLPDSMVVLRADGELLVRSEAVLHMMRGLGGVWRVMAALVRIVPRRLRDLGYDLVASIRLRLFQKPADVCPILPQELRVRFGR